MRSFKKKMLKQCHEEKCYSAEEVPTKRQQGSLARITPHRSCVATCILLWLMRSLKRKALGQCHEKTHHVGDDAVGEEPDVCEAGPDVLRKNRCDRLTLVKIRAEAVVTHTPNHDVHHCKIHTALSMSV